MTKCLAFETPDGVVHIIRPLYDDRTNGFGAVKGESESEYLRRVLARNVETAAQITRGGGLVNEHLTSATPVFVIEDAPGIGAPERMGWKIPPHASRIQ